MTSCNPATTSLAGAPISRALPFVPNCHYNQRCSALHIIDKLCAKTCGTSVELGRSRVKLAAASLDFFKPCVWPAPASVDTTLSQYDASGIGKRKFKIKRLL